MRHGLRHRAEPLELRGNWSTFHEHRPVGLVEIRLAVSTTGELAAIQLIVRKHAAALPDREVTAIAQAVLGALDRFERGYPENAEIAGRARAVAKAAEALREALSEMDPATWSAIQSADRSLIENGWLPPYESELGAMERIGAAASSATIRFSGRGRPLDRNRLGLGIELGGIWQYMTGEPVRVSGGQTIEEPRSKFSRFVADVLLLRPSTKRLRTAFSDFIRSAARARVEIMRDLDAS